MKRLGSQSTWAMHGRRAAALSLAVLEGGCLVQLCVCRGIRDMFLLFMKKTLYTQRLIVLVMD
jgi:hypothetical protein